MIAELPQLEQTTRRRYAYHKVRLTLRAVATVAMVIAMILFIVAAQNCYAIPAKYESDHFYCISFIGVPACLIGIFWNVAEFITLCVNKRGIHPGAHIALDFIILSILAAGVSIDIIFGLDSTNYGGGSMLGAGALEAVACALHLALFIFACIAVHKWRMDRNKRALEALAGCSCACHRAKMV